MTRKILMFFNQWCADSLVMMPVLRGMNMGGRYKFEFMDIGHNEEAKKTKEKYLSTLKKTGKENAVPSFIDVEKNEAIFAPNFEKLMVFLEGPQWWKTN